jgi:hypothetical protein
MFHLRCRGPGASAAELRVRLIGAAGLVITPADEANLTDNLADLQPRNHLYVTAGATRLGCTFPLDTAQLADGFHQLTAVAYEGSHTRTQTRVPLPVVLRNTTLDATLTLLDLGDIVPVEGTYHIQVTANATNDISSIALYTTGGILATVTNQSTATFQVGGASLGVGRHPFFALVRTGSGQSYRTEMKWVRFVRGQ